MGRTQYYCAATLDGYIADPDDGIDWLMGYEGSFEGEGTEASPMSEGGSYEAFYEDVGALVSGSTTYEFVLAEMTEAAGDRNLWVVGGGNVASQFADAGLLDEVLLTVVPVVLGEGKPLFDRAVPGGPLQLTGTAVHDTGMVALNFELRR